MHIFFQVLDSIAIQPIKNFEDLSPENLAKMARNQNTLVEPINPEYHLPFIFGNDVDSIDVATRVAMVKYKLTWHISTISFMPKDIYA